MNSILEDLWFGNIDPHESVAVNNEKFKTFLKEMSDTRDELTLSLSENQCKLLEVYDNKLNEINSISECDAFIFGIKFGIRLIIESL